MQGNASATSTSSPPEGRVYEEAAAGHNSPIMPGSGHDVVVIGASAGGVEALMELVSALPPDLPAAVLVVLHVPARMPSRLAQILDRAGPLPAAAAIDGETIEHGRIYVASPDWHLVVQEDGQRLRLSHGPHENHTRPAIDPLFRSAARAFGPRVAGVILSGALNDGSRGVAAVKAHRGIALVQDPNEAQVGSMPRAALAATSVDYVLPVKEIAARLAQLAIETVTDEEKAGMPTQEDAARQIINNDLEAQAQGIVRSGHGALYACPECGGVLWQISEHEVLHFECHTGHTYSPQNLLMLKSQMLEATLWAAVRLLTEKATLSRQLSAEYLTEGAESQRARIEEMTRLDEQKRETLQQMLEASPNPTGQAYAVEEALDQGQDPQNPSPGGS